jgi:8-oxo-dGTP pyrophosphatase MutT (NUDIX family)
VAETNTVFETPWFRIEAVPATPGGALEPDPYYRLCQGDGVVVMTLSENGEIVLVRQYRPPLERTTLEVPAGFQDKSESPEEAARREVLEETGHIVGELTYLGAGRSLMNRLVSREHMLLATGAVRQPDFRAAEDVEVVTVTPARFRQMIVSGKFEQMAAFSILFLMREKLGRTLF